MNNNINYVYGMPINTSMDLGNALNDMIRRVFGVGGSDGN